MHRLSYKLMLLFTILTTIGGILTLLPYTSASYPNVLGYSSLCTFAPAASFFCFFLAGTSCFIRSTLIKDQSGTKGDRLNRHSRSLIILTLILVLGIGSTLWFLDVKNEYTDGTTAASQEQEGI